MVHCNAMIRYFLPGLPRIPYSSSTQLRSAHPAPGQSLAYQVKHSLHSALLDEIFSIRFNSYSRSLSTGAGP